ncbi:peptidase S8 [Blastococcus sp. TF02-8]|uniref:S8 family serine peptidase n=1 Tax=Blastococcus sp. TF02-8 TaxID=2250574 RepID=UPI000DE8ABA4|nr:S8 family serine peptidase [Blastococcus sp. TF02-8]RBY97302.1 peptidase S8 [Blastococcus sp. TF02-8]
MHFSGRRLGRLLVGTAVIAATGVITPTAATAAPAGSTGPAQTYLVVFKGSASPADAARTVAAAGGSVVTDYRQIGVLVARSGNAAFADRVEADRRVEGVSATAGYATRLEDVEAEGPPAGDLPNAPATDADTFSGLQWDMRQMHTPEAHAITGGSREVVVGTIDTGVDYRHPDLRANISDADSANCLSGAPVQGAAAAADDNGHGTHTAGTIAAASNGAGIVGVAPNVRVAGIKAATAEGYFFPEAVVCSFVWAGDRGIDVTNNSYFVDPYLFNCRNEADQRAIWKAVQRAVRYAQQKGVTVVASEGNNSEDLSHPTADATSPDFPPGSEQEREVTNACVVLPVELPGVIGVTATGSLEQGTAAGRYADDLKSYYSSYGVSTADVAAPGGDFYFRGSDAGAQAIQGQVLSTWPSDLPCSRSRQEPTGDASYPTAVYCGIQGTSMAGPHVAGLAALVISRYGDLRNGSASMQPGRVASIIEGTADPQACPTVLPVATSGSRAGTPYAAFVGSESGAVQQCQGNGGHTSWYGAGQVDALAAVTGNRANG